MKAPARWLLFLLLAATLSGCAVEVAAGRRADGNPLRVKTREETLTSTGQVQVGEIQHTGAGGQPAGTSAIYATQTSVVQRTRWRPMQGAVAIADEDFFRIAGDDDAAEQSHRYRRRGQILVWSGAIVTALAVGAIVGAKQLDAGPIRTGLAVGGVLGVLYGPLATWYGFAYLSPDNHAVPMSRAEEAAQRYNATLGVSLGGRW